MVDSRAREKIERTSTVTTLIAAGFHRLRFHPSTHIAPRLSKLTVPSPSPIFTPFIIYYLHTRRLSIRCSRNSSVIRYPPLDWQYHLYNQHLSSFAVTLVYLIQESCSRVLDKQDPPLLHSRCRIHWVPERTYAKGKLFTLWIKVTRQTNRSVQFPCHVRKRRETSSMAHLVV